MTPGGATTICGIIGWPVSHSLSPAIHNRAFAIAGLDWAYAAFPVPPDRVADAVAGMRALSIAGLNVTMPHKQSVVPCLDRLSDGASRVGAVNTIACADGLLVGHNTDGEGLVRFLRGAAGFDPEGRRAVILGAGGAARGVAVALADAGSEVFVAARRDDQAREAAALAGGRAVGWEETAEADADLVVNATPLRSLPAGAAPGPGRVFVDLSYGVSEPPTMAEARAGGAIAHDGLGMLVEQAALAFEIWTGVTAPVEEMAAAAAEALGRAPDPSL